MRKLFAFLFLSAFTAPLAAQTLALPLTAPETMQAGKSAVVRPIVRDAIGRPTSVSRVIAVSSAPSVVAVSYASGGQRYTAKSVGVAVITWVWDRTDGERIRLVDTVRVIAAAPIEQPPPAVVDTLGIVASVILDPDTTIQLAVGDTVEFRVVGGTVGRGASARPATETELLGADIRWGGSGYVAMTPAADGLSARIYGAREGYRGRVDVLRGSGGPLIGQRWIDGIAAPPPPPPIVTRWVGMTPSSADCVRPLIAGEQLGVRADTALFVRPLAGLPAWAYCVADSLAVTLEGDLVVSGGSNSAPTLLAYAPGAALPVAWPATGQGDTTVTVDSLRITGAGSDGGIGTGTVLGLLGAGAVVSLLAGANALARRGRDEDV